MVTLSVILCLLPIISPLILALSLPPQYDETFFGALDEKYDRLTSLEGEKLVVVGGSSVAFGLDSERLEKYTGMPVVNFGLYADLGTKMMLDLSLDGIGEGDVVILAPELDAQTLSLYFNPQSALMAVDSDYKLFFSLPFSDIFSSFGAMWSFSADKWQRFVNSDPARTDGIYRSDSFNEYGDFALHRYENIMPLYADKNNAVDLSPSALSEEFYLFADYLNDYIKSCEGRGARVLFSFCPINEMGIKEGVTSADRVEFSRILEENINCEFISYLDDYILDAGYFYDTNFHLNDAGVSVRTIRLARDIRLALGIMEGVMGAVEPSAPALPRLDFFYPYPDSDSAEDFVYEELPDGGLAIIGLSPLAKEKKELVIPAGASGQKVIRINADALSGALCENLIVPADANLVLIEDGALSGAVELRALSIYKMSARDIMPPSFFSGVHPSFKVHVPVGSDYSSDYDWSGKAEFVFDLEIS